MTWTKMWGAVTASSIVGLVAITVYLVVARSVMTGISLVTGTEQLLQWDASNAYGSAAFSGGWALAVLGLLMDAIVSTCWATIFTAVYINVPVIRRYPLVSGVVYGAVVMCVMIYFVVPIGHARQAPHTLTSTLNTVIAHALFFGLPIAMIVRQKLSTFLQPRVPSLPA